MSQRATSPWNHRFIGSDGTPIHTSVATVAALAALTTGLAHGDEALVESNQATYYWHGTSTLAADNVLVVGAATAGRWLRKPGAVDLALPFTFATADATALLTMPAGAKLKLHELYWLIAADMTGGSSSAIGVSSAKTGFSTKGDLLGGAAGDVAATLVAATGTVPGTIGVGINSVAKLKSAIWLPGDTIRYDKITSAFTAGSGEVHVMGQLLANAGA